MGKASLLSWASFLFLIMLLHGCSAQLSGPQRFFWPNIQSQQQHRIRARTDCRVERLNTQEPTIRIESEAGWTEFWDQSNQQFECAGVAAVRNFIQPKGLLLPHYNNAPQIMYIVQGRGLQGTVIPGCAETFEREVQSGSGQRQRFTDRHQKIRQFRQGDVLALPHGMTLWFYNNGDEPLITVALLDSGNEANQLDWQFRNFFLAGNPRPRAGSQTYFGRREQQQEQGDKNNIFAGLNDNILAEAFNIDMEMVRNLKGKEDQRGRIVRVERFNVVFPGQTEEAEEEEERRWRISNSTVNGLEETLCTIKMRSNLDDPTRVDVYSPQGGRISTLNSQKLPILAWLRLSAEKGVLYRNAIMAPHWTVNAHTVIYFTRGSGRFQVVGHTGQSVFDGQVRAGQLIILPQNFVMMEKADEQGLEWISFKTNDNAIASPLAGRLSAIRAMPEEVVMNAYGISREDVRRLKYGREESRVLSSRTSTKGQRPRVVKYALDLIRTVM